MARSLLALAASHPPCGVATGSEVHAGKVQFALLSHVTTIDPDHDPSAVGSDAELLVKNSLQFHELGDACTQKLLVESMFTVSSDGAPETLVTELVRLVAMNDCTALSSMPLPPQAASRTTAPAASAIPLGTLITRALAVVSAAEPWPERSRKRTPCRRLALF
jgi:hypothetical protein